MSWDYFSVPWFFALGRHLGTYAQASGARALFSWLSRRFAPAILPCQPIPNIIARDPQQPGRRRDILVRLIEGLLQHSGDGFLQRKTGRGKSKARIKPIVTGRASATRRGGDDAGGQ